MKQLLLSVPKPWLGALALAVFGSFLNASFATQRVREMPSPAGEASAQPHLSVGKRGRVYLSWISRLPNKQYALRFAVKTGDRWSEARTIAEGSNWFVNWADFPSITELPDGS